MQTHQMPFHINPKHIADQPIAIVWARFNPEITQTLHRHAKIALMDQGVQEKNLIDLNVAGAVELPFAAQQAITQHQAAAVITLGCVIRGETAHFDYVCQMCAQGIMDVQLKHQCPVTFGVLTTETKAQAMTRANGALGTGATAALTALELLSLTTQPS